MTEDRDWELFKQKLKAKTEIDLDLYKEPQMKRRINNLITRAGYKGCVEYFDHVCEDKDDFAAFIEYLTINVSEFFRTPEKFSKLETDVIPDLLKRSSLAIIMKEMTPGTRHRILASDLDVEILAKAKRGVYTADEIKSMAPDRRRKYFEEDRDHFAVKPEIKSMIEFKRHNLLQDKFETGFDLILCRNVVIYFTDEAKDQLYRHFFEALKPGGILFVGATESILNFRKMGYTSFQPFFYQRPLEP